MKWALIVTLLVPGKAALDVPPRVNLFDDVQKCQEARPKYLRVYQERWPNLANYWRLECKPLQRISDR